MPIVSWKNGVAGDWSISTNWVGAVPAATDSASVDQSTFITISTKVGADYVSLTNSTVTINGAQASLTLTHDLSFAGSSMILLAGGALSATTFLGDANHTNAISGYGAVTGDLDTAHAMSVFASGGKLVYSGKFSSDDAGYIGDNATLELVKDPGDADSKIYLLGANATLKLDAPTAFHSQILDFDIGDKLDLAGLNVTSVTHNGATLSVTTSTNATYTYSLSGQLANTAPHAISDGAGGSNIYFTSLAPGFTSASSATLAENAVATTPVYTAKATSPSPTAKLTYNISGGIDASKFDIATATGVVTFKTSPNYEAPMDAGADNVYNIIVQASDGSLSSFLPVAITVTNVNEAPSITSVATATVAENFLATTPVYLPTGTDPDANAALAWTLGGADAAQFNVDKLTGAVTFKTSPNFDAPSDAGKNNVYDLILTLSDGALSATKAVAITVTNINEFTPTITSADAATVAENALTTAAVYTVKGADADAGTVLTYAIVGGADAALFSINGATGVVTFTNSPDFEAPTDTGANNVYDLIVSASDGSLVTTKSVSISVTNVNEFTPTITSGATATVVENISTSTPVYTVTGADADANTTLIYTISGGADAALFNIDKNNGAVTFKASPNFEAPSSAAKSNIYNLIVQASDGTKTSLTKTVVVTVTDVPEAPSITSAATVVKPENIIVPVYTVTAVDPDVPTTLVYSLAGGVDAALFTINPTTGVVAFINPPNFETPEDADSNNVYDITVQVTDGITSPVTRAVAITISNLNEAPTITSGATASAAENVSRSMTVYQAAATDPDAGTKLTWSIASGADSSLFNINAITGAVSFKASPNFEAPLDAGMNNVYNLIVRASDGQISTDKSVAITVSDLTEPSIGSVSFSATPSNATGVNPVAVAVAALDAGSAPDLIIANAGSNTVSVLLGNGDGTFKAQKAYAAGASPGAISVADLNDDGKKDLAVINAVGGFSVLLGNGDGSFKAPAAYATSIQSSALAIADMNGDGELDVVTANAATSSVSLLLGSGGGALQAPSLQAPSLQAAGSRPFSIAVADFNRDGAMDIVTANSSSQDVSILLGHGDGTFADQKTYAAGSNPVSVAIADFNRDGVLDLVTANKGDDGVSVILGNGDGTFQAQIHTSVGSDLISVSATDINGDGFADVVVGDLAPFDNVWVLLGDGNGALQSPTQYTAGAYPGGLDVADLNRDGARDIVVVNQGGAGASVLLNGGTAPSITSDEAATTETNVSPATPVYWVTARDLDVGASLTYSIAGGADASLFNINSATGAVTFKVSPNFQVPSDSGADNVYDVVVKASDGVLWAAKAIKITVINGAAPTPGPVANEAPSIISAGTATVPENILPTQVVHTVSATDPESANLSFSIVGGDDCALFNINGASGAVTFKAAPNFEAPSDAGANNVYDIIVRASDGSRYVDKALAISVTNVVEPPVLTSASAATVAENVATSTVVYAATIAHADAGATLTYSICGGEDANLFNINSTTGAVTFKASPNFEAPTDGDANNIYGIIVQVSDGATTPVTRAVAISVTNVNEAPSLTSATTATTAENISTSESVYTATASDPDVGATLTYAISGGADANLFNIDPTTGAVTFKASPNFEAARDVGANNVYDIMVRATDSYSFVDKAVAISVTNVNEAPGLTSAATATTAENVSTATAVYTATATDPDASSTLTYAITGGADAALFNINSRTGGVSFKASPNFEAPTDFGANNVYDIIVSAGDGLLSGDKAVAITVTNVDEGFSISSAAAATTPENVSTSAAVYAATATGLPAGATVLWSINGAGDAKLFNIDAATGAVTFKTSPNFEAPSDAGADNVYDISVHASSGSQSTDANVAITVTNVDEVSSAALTLGKDFNSDGKTDILFQNATNGACYVWGMNGLTIIAGGHGQIGPAVGTDWGIKATGDFNGDGMSDFLFQNVIDGRCYIWELNGSKIIDGGHGQVGPAVGQGWQVKATGDFNGDGKSDILFQNVDDGSSYIWELDGLIIVQSGYGLGSPVQNPTWQIKATGDFNGDGKSDVLFQSSIDGSCYIWQKDGLQIADGIFAQVGPAVGTAWQVRATGDFNGDGKSDILFHNANDGSCFIWEMNGLRIVDGSLVGGPTGTDWQITGTGDFNGDSKSDILFQNVQDGSCFIWEMEGLALNTAGYGQVGPALGADWHVMA